jgi:hypothetical protein
MRKERSAAKRGEETELQRFEREHEAAYLDRVGPQDAVPAVSTAGARHRK